MADKNEKKDSGAPKTVSLIAIFVMFFVSMGGTVVTPAMATLAEAFPDYDTTLINTLPQLFIVIASLIMGAFAGKKIKFRTLAILGSLLALIAGVAPAFIDNYWAILGCRAIFGLGLGFLCIMGNNLVVGNYEGDKQAAYLGYGSLFMNAGGIVLQMLGGVLADVSWQTTFYAHLLYIIALVMAFFIPETKTVLVTEKKNKVPLAKAVWAIGILMLIFNMLESPVMMNLSGLFEVRDAGGAAMAATALSIYTVAGCVGGLVFGKVFAKFSRGCLPIMYGCTFLGSAIVLLGESAAVMTVGMVLFGFGFGFCIPTFMAWVGKICVPENSTTGSSVIQAFLYLGAFLSSYWMMLVTQIFGEVVYSSLYIEIAVPLVLFIVFLIFNPYKEKKSAGVDAGSS